VGAGVGPSEAMMGRDAASRAAGVELVSVGPGRAVARMTVGAAQLNGHAIAHGGLVFLLADTAFACACNSHGPVAVAQAASITFLGPARAGDVLVAEAVERAVEGRTGVYDVTVRCGDRVVAEFRGQSRTVRPAAGEL
jgi:acyl-CoA thioesterase